MKTLKLVPHYCARYYNTYSPRSLAIADPKEDERQVLLSEAAFMTKSLYRICLRSVKVIRWGNEFDEKEFQQRDDEFSNPKAGGAFTMAPPPNRVDELRSRAEYYQSYARECFLQESDSLDNVPLREKDTRRYLYYLRKGNKDRKWLLADMMFKDPYKDAFLLEKVKQWEDLASKYLAIEEKPEPDYSEANKFFDDTEDEPDWFKQKYPDLR